MKRKIKLFLPIVVMLWFVSFTLSITFGVVLTVFGFISLCAFFMFLILNKFVKSTNWWRNQYLAVEQFVSNTGYRDNLIRNYDIVNLGSNSAHFAFFYEDVKGQSWATGSQGQDMDFEILKYFHSYLRKGGTVLIPIMPFTAISTYLKERPEYWGIAYYSKFAKILDSAQIRQLPYGLKLFRYIKYPLFYNWKAIRFLVCDTHPDTRYQLSEQGMMKMELEQDATIWIKNWLKEFKLQSLDDVKDSRWVKYYDEAICLNRQIVDFCIERGLKPVFIYLPMTRHLSSLFPKSFKQFMITDFVRKANVYNVPFLDYSKVELFQDDSLYFNSFFLNLRGRKLFTKHVINDIGLYH